MLEHHEDQLLSQIPLANMCEQLQNSINRASSILSRRIMQRAERGNYPTECYMRYATIAPGPRDEEVQIFRNFKGPQDTALPPSPNPESYRGSQSACVSALGPHTTAALGFRVYIRFTTSFEEKMKRLFVLQPSHIRTL